MTDNNFDWLLVGVAKVIAARRLELHLSQEELGSRCGLHRTYISDVERGARNLSLKSFARLADALELPPSVIFQAIEPDGKHTIGAPPHQGLARKETSKKAK